MEYRVLMVEDDPVQSEAVSHFLRKNGVAVACADSDDAARRLLHEQTFDLVLLDVALKNRKEEGYELCKWIRGEDENIPVFFTTGTRVDVRDQDKGVALGADDYIVKPYSMRLLLQKILTEIDRRRGRLHSGVAQELHGIAINRETHELTVDGRPVEDLPPKVFKLLDVLMESAGRVMSRQQLLDAVWGYDFFGDERVVDMHVSKLRAALCERGGAIKTVSGTGYKFRGE
ncbi:MAG: response regulator transcription factor [Oscillospiraceae bacterium]|nr:response regulator transcription factor [Oscillospiraceae bacterium]